jgi:hypothetical protein
VATLLTINVTNESPQTQNMFFFQKPSIYVGGYQVYSNSMYMSALSNYDASGSTLTFQVFLQYYAGVQEQVNPPDVGQSSGFTSATKAIDLTPDSGQTNNTTTMTLQPSLGLSPPFYSDAAQKGSFRIQVPSYDPTLKKFNAGSAVNLLNGGVVLSNFVSAQPTTNLDCQPILIFYVQTGTYTPGTVMNFTSSSAKAATCDFTPGYSTYKVTYTKEGQWQTKPFARLG